MKKINIFSFILMMCMMLIGGVTFTSCGEEDDLDTNQYGGGTMLLAYGPSPVARGGQLRFLGSGLDKVTAVVIPGCGEITDIERVSDEEIRVTVPQDAEPGLVTLKTSTGASLQTLTRLTFTEPVGFDESDAISPNPVKAGQTLTIKGEYLNLVTTVILADGVEISDFISHSRKEITLQVPAEAQTGKVTLSFVATGDTIPNEILSDDVLNVVAPAVESVVSLDKKKPGNEVTINGTDMDLVTAVVMDATGDSIAFESTETTVKFKMPANVTNSVISVRTASQLTIAIATVGVALPEVTAADPATGLRPNNVITITGTNLELVTNVTFPTSDGSATVDLEPGAAPEQIQVRMPEGSVSGNMVLNTAANLSVEVPFVTAKPIFESFAENPVSLGNTVTIKGQNMDLVSSVKFTGDAEVAVEGATYAEISVVAPYQNAESGKLTLIMANGETAETDALTLDAPLCCYVTAWPELADDEAIKAGSLMQVTVANADKLTGVTIDSQDCQYILNGGSTLYINVPSNAGKSSKITLVSSNGSITYDYAFTPNTEQTFPIWTGAVDLANWSFNWQFGDNTHSTGEDAHAFENMGLQEGDIIRIWATAYDAGWQIQFFDGHWSAQSEIGVATGLNNGNNINSGIYNLEEHGGYIEIPATATLATQLTTLNDWGYCWIMQGAGLIISKIDVLRHISLETTLWNGEADLGAWSVNWQIGDGTFGASNPNMFVDANLAEGQTIRLYVTNKADWWQVQFFDGHWGGQSEIGNATGLNNGNNINAGIYSLSDHNGAIEIPVTATLKEQLTTLNDWGYCWILQGESVIITKITLE